MTIVYREQKCRQMLGVAPDLDVENDGSRPRTPSKKNRRILTTVKAMEPFGEVSILGRLTQPII